MTNIIPNLFTSSYTHLQNAATRLQNDLKN